MITLPWLQENINQWTNMIVSNQVPHAILLSGISGIGKVELAKEMAQIALCEEVSEKGACQFCSACTLYNAGNHTDLSIVKAENSIIKVDQIRALSKKVILSSAKSQYKVVIIKNAEQMNKSSANALLKTLEEPPNKVIIILTTNEIGRLLPTIKSRCIKLNICPPNIKKAQDWLSSNSKAYIEDINFSLKVTNYAPIAAKKLLEGQKLIQIHKMLDDLKQILVFEKSVLETSKDWYKNKVFFNVKYIASFFLDQYKLQNKIQTETDDEQLPVLRKDVDIISFIAEAHRFMHQINTPLKKELLIENLLIYWKSVNKISPY